MGTAKHKLIRIRLKAETREEFARTFGPHLSEFGVFLPSPKTLPVGSEVRLSLLFFDGTDALNGVGTVTSSTTNPAGMQLTMQWAPRCRPMLYWVLGNAMLPAPPDTADIPDAHTLTAALDCLLEPQVELPISGSALPMEPAVEEDGSLSEDLLPFASSQDIALDGIEDFDDEEPILLDDVVEEPPEFYLPPAVTPPPQQVCKPVLAAPVLPVFVAPATAAALEPVLGAPAEPADAPVRDLLSDVFGQPAMTLQDAAEVLPEATADLAMATEVSTHDVADTATIEITEPVVMPEPSVEGPAVRTEYAFAASTARDELGPSPAPSNALIRGEIIPRNSQAILPEDREPGEVTPLARVELVRRSNSTVRAGELGPPPLDAVNRLPPTAIPNKRLKAELGPPSRRVLGIDVGDRTTRVAIIERGDARIVPSRRGAPGIPSAAFIDPAGKTIVGEPALRRLLWQPHNGIHGTKQLLGRLFCSPRVEVLKGDLPCRIGAAEEDEVALSVGEHFISFEEVEALVLKEVKAAAALALQDQINRAVLTCPPSFGIRQRRGLAVAAELAGLHVERVLSAPLVLVLGLLKQGRLHPGRYLVYDLGASFFDATVVEVKSHSARILATAGDSNLAGRAYDRALLGHVIEQLQIAQGVVPRSESEMLEVLEACEDAKCNLSTNHSARIVVQQPDSGDVPACEYEVEVSRTEAERLFGPLIAGSLAILRDVLSSAQVSETEVDGVLVVGAQTEMPLVQRTLGEVFGDRIVDLDARVANAQGAAWAAHDLESTAPFNLQERVAGTVTVAALGAKTQTLVVKGANLPAVGRIQYRAERTEDLHLYLFEGEHLSWQLDEPVAHLVLEVPSGGPSWPWHVDIDVEVDESGRLSLVAEDADTGEAVLVHNVPEFSRQQLTAHFAQAQPRPATTPRPGLVEHPGPSVDPSDEPYN